MCALEFPDLEQQIWQPLQEQGVVVIGVNTGGLEQGDDEQIINAFIQQTGVTFPVVQDQDQSAHYDIGAAISPFPVNIVIDRNGNIVLIKAEHKPDELLSAVLEAL